MWGFQANKMQRNISKAFLRGFGFTFFSTGDLNIRDWGFTLTRLGIHFCSIGDLQNRDWGFTEEASSR